MRLHTSLDVYMLQGEVPVTVILGGTSDISQFYENGFYDWILLRYEPIQYPDENTILGRYLGLAINIGPEMRDKIIKTNGEFVHRLTYRGLKKDYKYNQAHMLLRKGFNNSTREIFGPKFSPDEFPDVNKEDTPLYDMYEGDTTDAEGGLEGKIEDDEIPVTDNGLEYQVPREIFIHVSKREYIC